MKRSLFVLVIFGIGVMALLLAGCARTDFSAPVDLPGITTALEQAGLQVCAQEELDWSVTPGFVEGTSLVVGIDCSTFDPAQPEALVVAARFDSLAARDAALRSFETAHRRHIGSSLARGVGPWVIAVDGEQSPDAAMRLREALAVLEGQ